MWKVVISGVGFLTLLGGLASAQTNANEGKDDARKDVPVVLTVTTVAFAESTGCWAKIHDGENYSGRTLTLMGEQSLPNLEFGVGYDWEGDIDSVEVGPKATLVLYEDETYGDKSRALRPNERIADVHSSIFSEGIESMKLTCASNAK